MTLYSFVYGLAIFDKQSSVAGKNKTKTKTISFLFLYDKKYIFLLGNFKGPTKL